MDNVHIVNVEGMPWQPHPTIARVMTKVIENRESHPLADAMLAQVASGGEIPWHVHASASETAYVLQGTGALLYAQTVDEHNVPQQVQQASIASGTALTVPVGWWHSVVNQGTEPMLIFAFHTPGTF